MQLSYADDIVIGFEHEADARRFWNAMRERLREFSLTLHPDKSRLIEFGRHAARNREKRGLGKVGARLLDYDTAFLAAKEMAMVASLSVATPICGPLSRVGREF
jgi:hypothetical protein